MHQYSLRHSSRPVAMILSVILFSGCATARDSPQTGRSNAENAARPHESTGEGGDGAARADASNAIAFIVEGRPVRWARLQQRMIEAAGVTIMSELILESELRARLESQGIELTEAMIASEAQRLRHDLNANDDQATQMLRNLRHREGLGEVRYEALLWRNAALRALVAPGVTLTDAQLRNTYENRYGERRQARLIVLPDLRTAQRIVGELNAGATFTDLAMEHSIDASAPRGGLLAPISRHDSSYPQVVLTTLFELREGAVSRPILLENGYAVLRLERIIEPQDVPFEAVRDEVQRLTRRAHEQRAMESLAERLLQQADVTVFDDGLYRVWESR